MIKAVIFDMDGVLIDSEASDLFSLVDFCRTQKQNISYETIRKTVGMSMQEFWKTMGSLWDPAMDMNTMRAFLNTHNVLERKDYSDLKNPHMRYLLQNLKKEGLLCAIASASEMKEIQRMVKETQSEAYFDSLLSGCHLEKSKPDPAIYLLTMEKLGVKPEETIIVEDSEFGIKAGKASGATVIAIRDDRFQVDQSQADYIVSDLLFAQMKILELMES